MSMLGVQIMNMGLDGSIETHEVEEMLTGMFSYFIIMNVIAFSALAFIKAIDIDEENSKSIMRVIRRS